MELKTWLNPYSVLMVGLTLCGVVAGVLVYQDTVRLNQAITDLKTESKIQGRRFDAALGRAEVKIDTTGKILDRLAIDIPEQVRRDLDEHNAEIISIATATFRGSSSGGGRAYIVPSRSSGNGSREVSGAESKDSSESISVAGPAEFTWKFSDWRFDATLKAHCGEEGEFNYVLNQQFELVQTSGDDGSHYVQLYELGADGKHYGSPLKTESFNVVRKPEQLERFFVWAPHIDVALGANLGLAPQGELGLSAMGYGKTENDLSWKVIRAGVEYDAFHVGGILCPGSYNIGDPLPVVSNIWLSPCYVYDGVHGASVSIGASL